GYVAPDGSLGIARRNSWNYTYLATGPRISAGTHVLSFQISGATLSLSVDGAVMAQANDSAFSSGLAGMFDYNGAAQTIDDFTVGGTPGQTGGGGGGGGGSDGGTGGGSDAGTGGGGTDAGGTDAGTGGGGSAIVSDDFTGSGALASPWTVW